MKYTSALYLTYDGLGDQLGPSQITPYLKLISERVENLYLISFEKKGDYYFQELINELPKNIIWKRLQFTNSSNQVAKIYDLLRFIFFANSFLILKKINVIHARGHVGSFATFPFLFLLRKVRFIFDYRGMWIDERIDKGLFDTSKFVHKLEYLFGKKLEVAYLKRANKIIVLTNTIKDFFVKECNIPSLKIKVLPCVANFDSFRYTKNGRKFIREEFNIPNEAFLLGYVGSYGRMYACADTIKFFRLSLYRNNVYLLIVSNQVGEWLNALNQQLDEHEIKRVFIVSSKHSDLYKYLSAMDLMLALIVPSKARIASSPTKVGEAFAIGLPVLTNIGVGDLEIDIKKFNAGKVINIKEINHLKNDTINIKSLLDEVSSRSHIRNSAKANYSFIEAAIPVYDSLYKLSNKNKN